MVPHLHTRAGQALGQCGQQRGSLRSEGNGARLLPLDMKSELSCSLNQIGHCVHIDEVIVLAVVWTRVDKLFQRALGFG